MFKFNLDYFQAKRINDISLYCNDRYLLVILIHWENGSPLKPLLQTQIGIWFLTLQYALTPHRPGQGSWHFLLMQALSDGHSTLITHSGLQFGGEPIICGWQEHWHLYPLVNGGLLLGPQGFGSHGSTSATTAWIAKQISDKKINQKNSPF